MTVDTIFDIASLTKCVATATSVMRLVRQGKVRLNNPLTAYLAELGANGKNDITVTVRHSRGMPNIAESWRDAIEQFETVRAKYLLY